MKLKVLGLVALCLAIANCSSAQLAKNVSSVGFEEKPTPSKRLGEIKGKDCLWYVFGHGIGTTPSVYEAFLNAAHQKEDQLNPLKEGKAKGASLKKITNVTIENEFFSAYVIARNCTVVKGVGYL